ncbi:MAG: mechanosensitive ion channel [Treponema sp.]|jgi:small conductance mechanosensitive channel|nr:mechanosensitive ion channel [Treponema sp.]
MKQLFLNYWAANSAVIMEFIKDLALSVIILAVGIFLSRTAQRLIKNSNTERLPANGTVRPLLKAFVRYGILLISAIMILNIFGVNTASLLAVLGAAGIAVGLALKDTLGNIASGIILLILGSIRTGEFIEFGSYSGTVKETNLFTAILETPDGIHISAPYSSIWGSPIKNYTRNEKRRMDLSIGISYTDSVDAAFQVMQKIIASEERFLKNPAAQVIMQSIEDSSVKITIRAWVLNRQYWDIYWQMTKLIKEKIEEAGLHIPLPHRQIIMSN